MLHWLTKEREARAAKAAAEAEQVFRNAADWAERQMGYGDEGQQWIRDETARLVRAGERDQRTAISKAQLAVSRQASRLII